MCSHLSCRVQAKRAADKRKRQRDGDDDDDDDGFNSQDSDFEDMRGVAGVNN